jgi:hypothetical protein
VWGGERRGVYRILVGKFEGKRPLGRSRLRWGDNIKTDLKKDGGTWNGLNWLRMRTTVGLLLGGNKPWGSIKCKEFLDKLRNWYVFKDCTAWN